MVCCRSKNKHQKDIKLHAQNLLTTLGSITSIIKGGGTSMITFMKKDLHFEDE